MSDLRLGSVIVTEDMKADLDLVKEVKNGDRPAFSSSGQRARGPPVVRTANAPAAIPMFPLFIRPGLAFVTWLISRPS